jgi:ABC-type glycerol-3-phosphate transport system substrate-binding protein
MRHLAYGVVASLIVAASAPAMAGTTLSMWVRSDGEELTRKIVDAWNAGHDNKIQLTVIPSPQMVTKFATAAAAGDVPDILSIDLIFMPDFMKAEAISLSVSETMCAPIKIRYFGTLFFLLSNTRSILRRS